VINARTLLKEVERLEARRASRRREIPTDPVIFARAVGYDPDGWQERLLRSSHSRILINASRQSGKSSMAAILAMVRALHFPDSTVLVLSPALRQSGELYRKCAEIYAALGRPVPADSETKLSLTLSNGSRVLSLPGRTSDTVRGYTADLLICDEAARISEDLYTGVRPMLAITHGRLVALSTPAGMRGWWFEAWRSPDEAWERYEVAATEIPRISSAFLEEERLALPVRIYRQEYLCSFEATEDQVFALEDVDRAITDDVAPLFGHAEAS
jgi:hypothetical protein